MTESPYYRYSMTDKPSKKWRQPALRGIPIFIVAALFLALLSLQSFASPSQITVNNLVESEQLRLRAWLSPDQGIVASQQVELNIEVASTTWFTGGTKIARFEMQDAIVLRREKFAVNSSQEIGGVKWSTQLWTITIYPQRTGSFEVPVLGVDISVAADAEQNNDSLVPKVTGRLYTSAMTFTAEVPDEISQLSVPVNAELSWLATTNFAVEQTFDRELENVKAGDAIRRTVTISADNLAAMMLPSLTMSPQPGLAVYQKPAYIEDRINRGTYRATRRESATYVVEESGDYQLPGLKFYWWDVNNQRLETIELPARMITVAENASVSAKVDSTGKSAHSKLIPTIMLLCFVISLIGLAMVMRNKQRVPRWVFAALKPKSFDELKKELLKECREGNGQGVVKLLYKMLDESPNDSSFRRVFSQPLNAKAEVSKMLQTQAGFDGLMGAFFSDSERESAQGVDVAQYESLLVEISQLLMPEKRNRERSPFRRRESNDVLKLN